jgi:NitT/TauT family transport system substrate-binding protein
MIVMMLFLTGLLAAVALAISGRDRLISAHCGKTASGKGLVKRTRLGHEAAMRILLSLFALLLLALPAQAQTALTFHTDWKAQAEHGGFYQALALGLYKKRGLDVTIRPGGPQTDNTRLLASGAIDVGLVSNTFQAMTLAARGTQVRMVMAVFQKDPQVLMAHPGTPARTLADLRGRPLFLDDASIPSYFAWLKAQHGFTDAQIRKSGFSLAPWLQNKQAIQDGYVTSEPFTASKAGVTPQVLLLSDFGYPGYGAFVAATDEMIRTKPQVLRAFVQATQEGWLSYLTQDPAPAHRLIKRDNPDMRDALLSYGRSQLIGRGVVLSGTALTQGVGHMDPARWQAFARQFIALGLYPKSLKPETAYTNQFLARIVPPAAR